MEAQSRFTVEAKIKFAVKAIFFGALFLGVSIPSFLIEPLFLTGDSTLIIWKAISLTIFLPIGVPMFIASILLYRDLRPHQQS